MNVISESPLTILIVEDEQAIRRFVRSALESEGCRVCEANTMQHGLQEAGTRKPDLVILDLGLPDGNGVDFIRDLRAWSSMPVLVLSARIEEYDKVAALDAGADGGVSDAGNGGVVVVDEDGIATLQGAFYVKLLQSTIF